MAVLDLLEQIEDVVGSSRDRVENIFCRVIVFMNGRSKFGETDIKLLRILHLGNDENNTFRV